MRFIPLKHKKIINSDPYYRRCARWADGNCDGRMTIEHALIYAGQQIAEMWNYVPLCWFHHLGEGLFKAKNELIALSRATPKDLEKYPNKNWNLVRNIAEFKIKTVEARKK